MDKELQEKLNKDRENFKNICQKLQKLDYESIRNIKGLLRTRDGLSIAFTEIHNIKSENEELFNRIYRLYMETDNTIERLLSDVLIYDEIFDLIHTYYIERRNDDFLGENNEIMA